MWRRRARLGSAPALALAIRSRTPHYDIYSWSRFMTGPAHPDVGGDENTRVPRPELGHNRIALLLGHVAVHGRDREVGLPHLVGEPVHLWSRRNGFLSPCAVLVLRAARLLWVG